jgi:hypothetical protein
MAMLNNQMVYKVIESIYTIWLSIYTIWLIFIFI